MHILSMGATDNRTSSVADVRVHGATVYAHVSFAHVFNVQNNREPTGQ